MSRIIVALKDKTPGEAIDWARTLEGKIWGVKLNDILRNDLSFIQDIKQYCNVMADPKVFEIPEDMEIQVRKLVEAGSDIVTVHLSAFWTPPEDIVDKVVGVTVLTSFDDEKCLRVYGIANVTSKVNNFIIDAAELGYKWVVCSAADLRDISIKYCIQLNDLKVICPSIRMSDVQVVGDDQVRTATPTEAIKLGANFLVIGRPILQADDPVEMVDRINEEIRNAENIT